jgi:hypothetical protein
LTILAVSLGHDEFGVGAFDGLLEETAFEHLAAAFDAGLQEFGEIGILVGHGQLERELGLKDQALLLDLDLLDVDRSLKLLRGTQGDDLLWRGGVAMRALLPVPTQILQIRAQTGDRQEFLGFPIDWGEVDSELPMPLRSGTGFGSPTVTTGKRPEDQAGHGLSGSFFPADRPGRPNGPAPACRRA